ncbi:MAG: hypothetical protein WKF30_03785 [Pyrinomonadaceae bacterium]
MRSPDDLTKLGHALQANGEIENALTKHKRSVAMLEKLHHADAENFMVAHTLALSLEGLGDVSKAKQDFTKALESYRRGLLIEERLNSLAENYELQIKIAQLYFKLG